MKGPRPCASAQQGCNASTLPAIRGWFYTASGYVLQTHQQRPDESRTGDSPLLPNVLSSLLTQMWEAVALPSVTTSSFPRTIVAFPSGLGKRTLWATCVPLCHRVMLPAVVSCPCVFSVTWCSWWLFPYPFQHWGVGATSSALFAG